MAFVVLPIAWQQGIYLIRDMPGMLNKLSDFAATLPRRYPALIWTRALLMQWPKICAVGC